jgi:hypothetical protein
MFGDKAVQVLGDDATAARGEDVADKQDVHLGKRREGRSVAGESFRLTSVIDPKRPGGNPPSTFRLLL